MKNDHHAADRHVTLLKNFLHVTLYICVELHDLRTRFFRTNVPKTSLITERFSYANLNVQRPIVTTRPIYCPYISPAQGVSYDSHS
jgi:hypothetical protein